MSDENPQGGCKTHGSFAVCGHTTETCPDTTEGEPVQDTRPDWIKDSAVGTGEIEYGGKKIPFSVLVKELAPTLPGFLGFSGGEFLFISEDVPEKFRLPQLIHEIVEFTELKGQKGRCVEALKRELAVVPDEIQKEYIEYRRNFFARLIEYYKNSDNEEFKEEIAASFKFLQEL